MTTSCLLFNRQNVLLASRDDATVIPRIGELLEIEDPESPGYTCLYKIETVIHKMHGVVYLIGVLA